MLVKPLILRKQDAVSEAEGAANSPASERRSA